MPFQSRPCARALFVTALVVGAATSGLAQSLSTTPTSPLQQTPPAAPAPQGGTQSQQGGGPTRSLSIHTSAQGAALR